MRRWIKQIQSSHRKGGPNIDPRSREMKGFRSRFEAKRYAEKARMASRSRSPNFMKAADSALGLENATPSENDWNQSRQVESRTTIASGLVSDQAPPKPLV